MSDYDKDFSIWAKQQAELLQRRRFDDIDLPNVIEEIESMSRQVKRELLDGMSEVVRLRLLLYALPDHDWVPYWKLKLGEHCYMNTLLMRDAPSLKDELPAISEDALEAGQLRANEELAYAFPNKSFDEMFSSMQLLTVDDFFK